MDSTPPAPALGNTTTRKRKSAEELTGQNPKKARGARAIPDSKKIKVPDFNSAFFNDICDLKVPANKFLKKQPFLLSESKSLNRKLTQDVVEAKQLAQDYPKWQVASHADHVECSDLDIVDFAIRQAISHNWRSGIFDGGDLDPIQTYQKYLQKSNEKDATWMTKDKEAIVEFIVGAPTSTVRKNRDNAAKSMLTHPLLKKLPDDQAEEVGKMVVRLFNDKLRMRLSILYGIDANSLLAKGVSKEEIRSLLFLPSNKVLTQNYKIRDEVNQQAGDRWDLEDLLDDGTSAATAISESGERFKKKTITKKGVQTNRKGIKNEPDVDVGDGTVEVKQEPRDQDGFDNDRTNGGSSMGEGRVDQQPQNINMAAPKMKNSAAAGTDAGFEKSSSTATSLPATISQSTTGSQSSDPPLRSIPMPKDLQRFLPTDAETSTWTNGGDVKGVGYTVGEQAMAKFVPGCISSVEGVALKYQLDRQNVLWNAARLAIARIRSFRHETEKKTRQREAAESSTEDVNKGDEMINASPQQDGEQHDTVTDLKSTTKENHPVSPALSDPVEDNKEGDGAQSSPSGGLTHDVSMTGSSAVPPASEPTRDSSIADPGEMLPAAESARGSNMTGSSAVPPAAEPTRDSSIADLVEAPPAGESTQDASMADPRAAPPIGELNQELTSTSISDSEKSPNPEIPTKEETPLLIPVTNAQGTSNPFQSSNEVAEDTLVPLNGVVESHLQVGVDAPGHDSSEIKADSITREDATSPESTEVPHLDGGSMSAIETQESGPTIPSMEPERGSASTGGNATSSSKSTTPVSPTSDLDSILQAEKSACANEDEDTQEPPSTALIPGVLTSNQSQNSPSGGAAEVQIIAQDAKQHMEMGSGGEDALAFPS